MSPKSLSDPPITMTDRLFIALRSYVELNEAVADLFPWSEWIELRSKLLRRKLISKTVFKDGGGSTTHSYRATARGRRAVGDLRPVQAAPT